MEHEFEKIIDRRNSYSMKWDFNESMFGEKYLLPMWVADMDFMSPPAVVEALIKRSSHGIFGYTKFDDDFWSVMKAWYATRHSWKIPQEGIVFSPGVVTSLSIAVDCYSKPGDKIVIMPPVYYPFYEVINNNDRLIEKCPLILKDNCYLMDFDHLAELFQQGSRLLILCNPHNPGGRVWSREELTRLGQLCLQYNVLVISDEIHCDLAFTGFKYTPYASISSDMAENSITCLAPSKTFNIPGIQSSFTIIYDPAKKELFAKRINALSLNSPGCFTPIAVKACYEQGGEWLDQVLLYLEENLAVAMEFFAQQLPELIPMRPEATYLLWVDCRPLGLSVEGLQELMYKKAGIAFSEGSVFGEEGVGYLRINLACPRSLLQEGLTRFHKAIRL